MRGPYKLSPEKLALEERARILCEETKGFRQYRQRAQIVLSLPIDIAESIAKKAKATKEQVTVSKLILKILKEATND